MSKPLFENDVDSEEELKFGTNEQFAKVYNHYRKNELLKRLKDKEGDVDNSDSDSSEDDELAYNPKFDEEFYKTLASLKKKDPKIYNREVKFFDGVDIDAPLSTEKQIKPLTVKEYEHKILIEKKGIYEDEDDESETKQNIRSASPSYREEQDQLKSEFQKVINDGSDQEDEAWGGIFVKREKTKEEEEKDHEEQEKWQIENTAKDVWSDQKLSKDEKFLRDYILSNGYADKDDDEIPTYDEIVAEDNDDFEDKQTEFEHKYNFRFEEPDQEFIKRYPRTIENSVRRTDERRKVKRVEVRERKEKEKEEKFKEIEMLKALKKKEIDEKIEKLKIVTGDDALNINDIDLEGDFDPDEYDKKMQSIFNNQYYQIDEGEEKPKCPSDLSDLSDLETEDYDNYELKRGPHNPGAHCEDEDFNMDCDYNAEGEKDKKISFQNELIGNSRNKRNRRKRKSKFMEMLEQEKPAYDPEKEKSFGEYLDEYYKLDCEDVVGDVKCRFKYVETEPNDFGLSVEEILLAKNRELNAWASMKKTTQIRPEHVEKNDREMYRRKARNEMLKKKILTSLYEEPSDDEPEISTEVTKMIPLNADEAEENDGNNGGASEANKKKKKKKKKKKTSQSSSEESHQVAHGPSTSRADTSTKSQKTFEETPPVSKNIANSDQSNSNVKKVNTNFTNVAKNQNNRNNNKSNRKPNNGLTDERLKAFGINPKKYNWKVKHGMIENSTSNSNGKRPLDRGNKSHRSQKSGPPNKKMKFD